MEITELIQKKPDEIQYDEHVKQVLAQRRVLAHILKGVVPEFKDMEIETIMDCIMDAAVLSVASQPGAMNHRSGSIVGLNTESIVTDEGRITFDILFYVTCTIKPYSFLINIEAQKDEPTQYDLLNRGIYYIARLISSQKERDFTHSNFNGMIPVYSIWICMNEKTCSMNHIHFTQEQLVGDRIWEGNTGIPNLVMLGVTNEIPENKGMELFRLLSTILTDKESAETRIAILREEFGFAAQEADAMKEEVDTMCNLSQGIKERAMSQGISQSLVENIENLMDSLGITLEKACELLKTTVEKYHQAKHLL